MGGVRLDSRLVAEGLAPTRSRARDLILRGFVRVDGEVCDRPGRDCPSSAAIELTNGAPRFVSRGAEKLVVALDSFAFDPRGLVALDIGASTGGFTEVLLQRGSRRVYAVDVGSAQLHPTLSADDRVVSLERTDARSLTADAFDEPIGAIVADVSFISLTKALGPALALAANPCWRVALIKPQFEVGPDLVGSGGVVRDATARDATVDAVRRWIAEQAGWRVAGVMPSPILGGSGNVEYLLGAVRDA